MSFSGKPANRDICEQQQLCINISDKDDKDKNGQLTPTHRTHADTAKIENGNRITVTPDTLSIGSRIMQILNSVHKKPVLYFVVIQKYS
ncbi:hypothetical protein WUBG_05827, partial [Wuchereria bancrofti]